jgi:hypothetical protein
MFLKNAGQSVSDYRALLRCLYSRRSGYYSDHDIHKESFTYGLLFVVWMCCEAAFSWATALSRTFIRGVSEPKRSYDVVALVYQKDPTLGLNDIYWADAFRKMAMYRVLAVNGTHLDRSALNFYAAISDGVVSLRNYFQFFFSTTGTFESRKVSKFFVHSLLGVLSPCFGCALRGDFSLYQLGLIIKVGIRTCQVTSLLETTGAKGTWAMVEGNDLNSLAFTLAAEQVNGVCFGSTWSMPYAPRLGDAIARNHVLFVWGNRQEAIYRDSRAMPNSYIQTGYPTCRYYSQPPKSRDKIFYPAWLARVLKESGRKRVVTFYDNVCGRDIIITREEMIKLVLTLFSWLNSHEEVFLVLKVKRSTGMDYTSAVANEIRLFERQGALMIRSEKADLGVGMVSDAVVGVSSSTLA